MIKMQGSIKEKNNIEDFISSLEGKDIHIVGATGAEGSSILSFLRKYKIENITVHDFLSEKNVETSFNRWHRGLDPKEKEKKYLQFLRDLSSTKFKTGKEYLDSLEEADVAFVPQSWRLYQRRNAKLFAVHDKGIDFYSLTRLYFDLSSATIVAVTGTVGKGSVASIIFNLLKSAGKTVYFAGNETWTAQVAEKLGGMRKEDILVLEVSHRQIQDGFAKAPHIVLITNIYPNHLSEINYSRYVSLKLSLAKRQDKEDITILNFDNQKLREESKLLQSKVYYFSAKNNKMNIKSMQNIYNTIMSKKTRHYPINLLSAGTAASILGVSQEEIERNIFNVEILAGRIESLGMINGVEFINDIKSTTPWATLAAVERFGNDTVMVCGGRTKGINYRSFAKNITKKTKATVVIKSQLSRELESILGSGKIEVSDNLGDALTKAIKLADFKGKIVVSPAASFFYSDFIKGKTSLRKLFFKFKHSAETKSS